MKAIGLVLLGLFPILTVGCAGVQPRYHEVATGETLTGLATRFSVPVAELKRHNKMIVQKGLKPGVKLYIPYESSPHWDQTVEEELRTARAPQAVALSVPMSWPVKGRVTSQFGWRSRRMHEGIDIAANTGTGVRAARSGHVIYAASHIPGYGKMVIVRHADSFSSVYAHLSKIQVKKGQFIARGQKVGLVGRTGRATGPHLHFEVRNHSNAVDPLLYLQGQYADNRIQGR